MSRLRSWVDTRITAIGVWFFFTGLAFTILNTVREKYNILAVGSTGGGHWDVSAAGLIVNLATALAAPLVYNSVFLVAVGVLLKTWRVTLVGFENAQSSELRVTGPDSDKTVWIGKRYPSRHDAELAADALSKRLPRVR